VFHDPENEKTEREDESTDRKRAVNENEDVQLQQTVSPT
jgi:hypothetical protein